MEVGLIIGVMVTLALGGFFSGMETGVYCLNRVRLAVRAEKGNPQARRLRALMRRPQDLVVTTLLGTNISDYLATVCVTALLLRICGEEGLAEVYATLILTPLVLAFGGVIPKDLFQRKADRLMYALAVPLTWCWKAVRFSGLIRAFDGLTARLIRRIDPTHADTAGQLLPRLQMQRMLGEGAVSGGLSAFQRDTLERVMGISRVRVRDVMVPRRRAAMVPQDVSRDHLLRIARMAHFSRLPVYDGDQRQVVGIINVYHVLTDEQERPVQEYIRPATFLRASRSVPAALIEMQHARQVMAIVTDSQGQCIGLLTIKDLVEEIVGELEVW